MSYHLVKLHPQLLGGRDAHRDTMLQTRAEKERVVRDFYEKRQSIPLCVDHCGASRGGFVVPQEQRIGRVVDLFTDKHGQLLVKLHLTGGTPAFQQITQETHQGVPWGVSVWIDVLRDRAGGAIREKRLTHVALTRDPYFAHHNTFMRDWSPSEAGIDALVVKNALYREGQGECYAAEPFKAKLKVISDRNASRMSMQVEPQQQQAPPPQQAVAESDGSDALKKQRLANDPETGQQRQQQRVMIPLPSLDECDLENAKSVNTKFHEYDKWIKDSAMPYGEIPPAVLDEHALLRLQKKKHDEVFAATVRQMQEHGFDIQQLDSFKPTERDTFYDYVACNNTAMAKKDAELQRLEDERKQWQEKFEASQQSMPYSVKSTSRQYQQQQAPVSQPPLLPQERREPVRDDAVSNLLASFAKPSIYDKQQDPNFMAKYGHQLEGAQNLIRGKVQKFST